MLQLNSRGESARGAAQAAKPYSPQFGLAGLLAADGRVGVRSLHPALRRVGARDSRQTLIRFASLRMSAPLQRIGASKAILLLIAQNQSRHASLCLTPLLPNRQKKRDDL